MFRFRFRFVVLFSASLLELVVLFAPLTWWSIRFPDPLFELFLIIVAQTVCALNIIQGANGGFLLVVAVGCSMACDETVSCTFVAEKRGRTSQSNR